jgi:hypothetical protein
VAVSVPGSRITPLLSRAVGSTRLRLLVDEADWQPRLRGAALAFGTATGYVWRRTSELRRPNTRAVGLKSLSMRDG